MTSRKDMPSGVKREDLAALIDENSELEGRCAFTGAAVVNGKLRGEISATDSLVIGATAVVNAEIRAGIVVIAGEVVGNVYATTRVELRGTARMFGDVEAPNVIIEEGVLFEGQCRMTPSRAPEPNATLTVLAGH
jgi:cytoskeletal protein CcmA (bactofilin family)